MSDLQRFLPLALNHRDHRATTKPVLGQVEIEEEIREDPNRSVPMLKQEEEEEGPESNPPKAFASAERMYGVFFFFKGR